MPGSMFQSTPPARAATNAIALTGFAGVFQSTPPARAATVRAGSSACQAGCFNPRRPRGRRPDHELRGPRYRSVSIHAARAGGDAATP